MKIVSKQICICFKLLGLRNNFLKVTFLYFIVNVSLNGLAQPIQCIHSGDNTLQKISVWRIIGPFKNTLKNVKRTDSLTYIAQRDNLKIIDTIFHQNSARTNLDVLLSTKQKVIAYATCELYSEEDQEVIFFIKVDDKMKLWVNDDPLISVQKHTRNGAIPKKSKLKKGTNRIYIELENNGREWWFDLAILGNKGTKQILESMDKDSPTNLVQENQAPRTQLVNWRVIGPLKNQLEDVADFELVKALSYVSGYSPIDTVYQQGKPGNSLYQLLNTREENRIAYATCNVFSNEDRDVILDLRVDDELRLWINDKKILETPADRIAVKKVHLNKGNNTVIAEIKNEHLDWWFEIAISGIDYVRDNMLIPGYSLTSVNPIIAKGDSLMVAVADTNFIPIRSVSHIKIFDACNVNVYSGEIDIRRKQKIPLSKLATGAYKYKLYTDLDTLSEYFYYGPLDTTFIPLKFRNKNKNFQIANRSLKPYIGRIDRLLSDYKKQPGVLLAKKIAHCLFKIKEIELAQEKNSTKYLHSSGLNIKSFISTIDHGDEHYLLYIPENILQSQNAIPLIVMVPFVTNNHSFYTGTILANYERMAYISRFADRYGFAVMFPSSRIFKWYNQTPITTKAITESVEDAFKYYNLDRGRVFLYGECSGALFALQAAIRKPDLFASIALRGPELSTINLKQEENSGLIANNIFSLVDNLVGKPILVLHSNLDHAASINFTNILVDSIRKTGNIVNYNSLPGLIKDYDMTSYSESEVINATFSFFKDVKGIEKSALKKISTYAIYNDSAYGFFVKEKETLGKATISYQLKSNRLDLFTTNIRSLIIDQRKLKTNTIKNLDIFNNGKKCIKGIDYRIQNNTIELRLSNEDDNREKNIIREAYGPVNKVFLKTFAIVRPTKTSNKSKQLISAIDSIWLNEYKNHVLIINENKIDSAKKAGINLIYILDTIQKVPKKVLQASGIELQNDIWMIESESYSSPGFAYSFYQNEDNKDILFLGCDNEVVPFEMLKSIFIREGWYDFEIWEGDMPFFQRNYKKI